MERGRVGGRRRERGRGVAERSRGQKGNNTTS